jgi:ligand-binding sensor domain-containing protein
VLLCGQNVNYIFNTLTLQSGLSTSDNSFVYKDTKGLVWISSTDGLNCYNGVDIKVYRPNTNDSRSMIGENIQSRFIEDKNTDIWFTTWNGINRYIREEDSFTHYQFKDHRGYAVKDDYQLIDVWSERRLLVRNKGTVYMYDIMTARQDSLVPLNGFRFDKYQNKDTKIYLAYSLGYTPGVEILSFVSNRNVTKKNYFDGSKKNHPLLQVFGAEIASETEIWLTTDKGLVRFNFVTEEFSIYSLPSEEPLFDVVKINQKALLISSRNSGLHIFDVSIQKFTQQIKPNPLFNLGLKKLRNDELYLDRDSILWVSQWSHGIQFTDLKNRHFQYIIIGDQPKESSLYSVSSVMMPHTKGVGLLLNSKSDLYTIDYDLKKYCKWGSLPDKIKMLKVINDEIYAVSRRNVDKIQDQKLIKLNKYPFDFQCQHISFWRDKFIVSTFDKVYTCDQNFNTFTEVLRNEDGIELVHTDMDENFYVSMNFNDLMVIKKDNTKHYLKNIGMVSGLDFHPSKAITYIATSKGLVTLDRSTWKYDVFDHIDGLRSAYVHNVFYKNGRIWCGTNDGIFSKDENSDFFVTYRQADGLIENEFYMHSSCVVDNHRISFVNSNQLNIIDTRIVKSLQSECPNYFYNRVYFNDQINEVFDPSIEPKNVTFPFNKNTVTFSFNAVNYSGSEAGRTRYFLEGVDKYWIEWMSGPKAIARYPNLSPGKYVFNTNFGSSQGWCTQVHRFFFTIQPPWYQSWWFFVLVGSFAISLSYLLYKYRTGQIEKEYELRLEISNLQRAALQAQMNPHFIFNCLNSIQNFIMKNDKLAAMEYLNTFAQLIRQNLNASHEYSLGLGEEISMLTNYLLLEKMRYSDSFDYEISVQEDLDPLLIELPPLLIQPFVENAIIHGIPTAKDRGKVEIQFIRSNDTLQAIVKDNGRGIHHTGPTSHKSLGMTITQKRLAYLNDNPSRDYNFFVDSNENGTSVYIFLKLK